MTSNQFMNSRRTTFAGGNVRLPASGERRGSVTAKESPLPAIGTLATKVKVKVYAVSVRNGALKITEQPRKVISEPA